MKLRKLTIFVLVLTLLLSSSFLFAKIYDLTILHTNDHHGHFDKFDPYPVKGVGGFAVQSSMIKAIRAEVEAEGGNLLILSAGDVNTGIPESDLLDAEPDFKMMNLLGFDAMTLGNHEFDNSREVLFKQMEWADFPFLSANTLYKESGKTLVEPFVIKKFKKGLFKKSLKVAIIGLTEPRTSILTLPENVKDLDFVDPIKTAKDIVAKVEKKADIVIALTHLGYYPPNEKQSDDLGDIELAKGVDGIDIIVGGHTHTKIKEADIVNGAIIVQAGGYSRYMGRLDVKYDDKNGNVTLKNYELLGVNDKERITVDGERKVVPKGKQYDEDPQIIEALKPYLAQADKKLGEPLGEASVVLGGAKKDVRGKETNLGNLITDAMLDKSGAEIAFQNGGGIRASINPGTITYRDILTVQPFGNTLTTLDMSGAQVMEVLNFAATIKSGSGAFLHAGGIKWTMNRGTKKAENVSVGGEPIDLNKTYKVVTNNFMATGGDGYKMLSVLPSYDTGFVDADALKDYIVKLGVVSPEVEGRLTIIE